MKLTWYYYFSWWVFIWFILYKLEIVKYTPYLIYLFIIIYILFKIIVNLINMIIDKYKGNYKIKYYGGLLAWLLIVISIDIIPFFYLKKKIDIESIIFTLILLGIYLLFVIHHSDDISKPYDLVRPYIKLTYKNIDRKYTFNSFMREVFIP